MVKGVTRGVAVAGVLAAIAICAPLAGADTTWTKISTDYNANIVIPSLGLTGTTAVVAWTQETSPSTSDLNAASFTPSATEDAAGLVQTKVLQAWAQIDYTHAIFPAPGGGLQLIYNGIHSTTTGDPLNAMATTLRNADGSWAAPFAVSGSSSGPTTGVLSGATPLAAGYATQGIEIFNTSVAHAPGASDQNLQPQLGGCCGYVPTMALDSAGHLFIAWYSNATGATGVYVQQLDPTTGAPMGTPALAPNSESSNNNSFGAALACAATCRVLYGNSPAAGPADTIVSWWPGQSTPTTIANLAATGQGAGRVLTAAYRADGRLWVAWFDGKTYRATLGDASGAGGVVQDAGAPKSTGGSAFALKGIAVGDNFLLAANFAWAPSAQLPLALFVNTVAPPAPVTKAPGPRDVTLQAGPGKTFRIQVQYTLPKACTGAARCTLHGELRTRTGRRLYAVTPLPGDTKLVLGTRGTFAVPKGKKGKIRFYVVVSKAQLLKAPFSTEGGSRVAETRLRVWYTPKGGSEALSVRDGRIKVSIARIKSGALPGLSGIL
jgi:hypothetical protein